MKYDKLNVIDLECSCWHGPIPENQRSEIIQIGICSLILQSMQIVDKRSYIIKPRFSTISKYCEDLTGITHDVAKRGMLFSDACNSILKQFGPRNRAWAGYGIGDKLAFAAECEFKHAVYPFNENYIDVSLLSNIKVGAGAKISLANALQIFGLSFAGRQHSADDDAYNTALLLSMLI